MFLNICTLLVELSLILASWLTNKRIDAIERDLYGYDEEKQDAFTEWEEFGNDDTEDTPEGEN